MPDGLRGISGNNLRAYDQAAWSEEQRQENIENPPDYVADAMGDYLKPIEYEVITGPHGEILGTQRVPHDTYNEEINNLNSQIDSATDQTEIDRLTAERDELEKERYDLTQEIAGCLGSTSDPKVCEQYEDIITATTKDGKTTYGLTENVEDTVAENAAQATSARQQYLEHEQWQKQRDTISQITDEAAKYAWNKWIKEWTSLDRLGAWGADLSDLFNTWVNPDSWENSLCDPDNGIFANPREDMDFVAFDCDGDNCNSALTFTMERSPYNWTEEERTDENIDFYIYSWVYLMGPVQKDFKFNIYFIYKDGLTDNEYCVYKNDVTETCKMTSIAATEETHEQISFVSENKYIEVCFRFDKKFPNAESGSNANTEFCRPVVEDAFDTGEPDSDFDMNGGDSSDESGSDSSAIYG